MMTDREEQAERRRILLQDRNVRDSFHSRTITEFDSGSEMGRFKNYTQHQVTSAQPVPQYPKLPSGPWSESLDALTGIEPPLGFSIDEVEADGMLGVESSPSGETSDDQHSGEVSPSSSPEPPDLPIALADAPAPGALPVVAGAHSSKQFKRRV
jgi:hypothetical protein